MKSRFPVLVLFVCALGAAERHPWAGFLPGSYARWKTVIRSGEREASAEVKQTVIAVGLTHTLLETETLYEGRLLRTRMQVPLRAETPALPLGKIVTLAKETVIVQSQAVSVVCYESASEARRGRTSERSCLSEEVPGGVVRSRIWLDGVESSTELVAFRVH